MNDRRKNFLEAHVRSADRNKVRRFGKNFDKLTEQELIQLSDIMRGSEGKSTDEIFESLCQWGWFSKDIVSMFRRLYK